MIFVHRLTRTVKRKNNFRNKVLFLKLHLNNIVVYYRFIEYTNDKVPRANQIYLVSEKLKNYTAYFERKDYDKEI